MVLEIVSLSGTWGLSIRMSLLVSKSPNSACLCLPGSGVIEIHAIMVVFIRVLGSRAPSYIQITLPTVLVSLSFLDV